LNLAIAAANQANLEDLEMCISASERLTKASVNLEARLRGDLAAEGAAVAGWQADLACVAPARERLNGAIKLLKQRQLRMTLRTASNAIDRALMAAREALRSKDPVDIDGVHLQLAKKIGKMESAAERVDGELSAKDSESCGRLRSHCGGCGEESRSSRTPQKKSSRLWEDCSRGHQN
jgi:hypothetical protein